LRPSGGQDDGPWTFPCLLGQLLVQGWALVRLSRRGGGSVPPPAPLRRGTPPISRGGRPRREIPNCFRRCRRRALPVLGGGETSPPQPGQATAGQPGLFEDQGKLGRPRQSKSSSGQAAPKTCT
jgi:hypothetical protein